MHSTVIDQIRTRVWLEEIRALTGERTTHALARQLDPESAWIGLGGVAHQSKWYHYERGTSVPSVSLANKVRSSLPGLRFDLHHPAWTLLRKPSPSARTIRRLVHRMPLMWQRTLTELTETDFLFKRINVGLVTRYRLAEFSYLDALLLFELGRRAAFNTKWDNFVNLTFIILALPLLYISDPLWSLQDKPSQKETIRAIVQSMRLSGHHLKWICFPEDRLVQAIEMLGNLQRLHLLKHPHALNSHTQITRFLAQSLGDNPDEAYARATSAFVRESRHSLDLSPNALGVHPYGQYFWQCAWDLITSKATNEPDASV